MFVSAHDVTWDIDFHFHFLLHTHCVLRSAPYRPYRWFTRILKVMSPTRSLKRASLRTASISGSTRISATTRWIWRSKTSSQRICWLHHCRTGARSKCRPTTTSLSLAQRKLGHRLFQTSIQHGETFCFGALWNKERCHRDSWKKESAASLKGVLWNIEAILPSWEGWSRHSWTSTTRRHEENDKNFPKNCLYEEEHYENFVLEDFKK